jgi:hypothetical protein
MVRSAPTIAIVALAADSVVARLPKALKAMGLSGDGMPAGAQPSANDAEQRTVRVLAPEQLSVSEGLGYECAIMRMHEANGREVVAGRLLIQPLCTGLVRETYLEYSAGILGADFGQRIEHLLTRHQKPRRSRVRRANCLCAELAVPKAAPPPCDSYGTSLLSKKIVQRARHSPILLPFKCRPCVDLGAPTVNLAPTTSSVDARRYNEHSRHAWSAVLVGNFVEERDRVELAPELNFLPWGSEAQVVGACTDPHDPTWTGSGGDDIGVARPGYYSRGQL